VAYDASVLEPVRVNSQFRIKVDGNRYSVPCCYASGRLTLKRLPERVLIYQNEKLVAEHVRSYDRNQDFESPDHVQPLLLQRKKARDQKLFLRFLALSPKARGCNHRSTTRFPSQESSFLFRGADTPDRIEQTTGHTR
jgi:hypothetical protein